MPEICGYAPVGAPRPMAIEYVPDAVTFALFPRAMLFAPDVVSNDPIATNDDVLSFPIAIASFPFAMLRNPIATLLLPSA